MPKDYMSIDEVIIGWKGIRESIAYGCIPPTETIEKLIRSTLHHLYVMREW